MYKETKLEHSVVLNHLIETTLVPIAIIMVALVPRVLDLGRFATVDEVNFWFARSEAFLRALQTRNFAATAITDHPGVTTMWLGAVSLLLRDALVALGMLRQIAPQTFVGLFELPVAVVHSIVIGIGYLLLRRIVGPLFAVLGALLWALDPFLIGYSRVLHVDALAGSFMTLSVLAAVCYWFHGMRWKDLLVSAVCSGLGIVTKSPALILVPTVAGIALLAWWEKHRQGTRQLVVQPLLVWGFLTVATAVVVWPALWSAPLAAFEQIRIGYTAEGTQPHQTGNFFLGQPDPAPGLLFYPVAIALRLTPITMLGIIALPWAWQRVGLSREARLSMASVAWFALLFTCAMSLFAKKFNRYILPAFPALDLLAALGLAWLAAYVLPALLQRMDMCKRRHVITAGTLTLTVVLAALNVAWWHPYSIAAYNQLLGGARVGAWAFQTGWGEGMDQVAAWLNQQPNITGVVTATTLKTGLQTYLRPGAQSLTPPVGPLPAQTGYVVIYINDAQGNNLPAPFDKFYKHERPVETIFIHGVAYAWIYQVPPLVEHVIDARFGDELALLGINRPHDPMLGAPLRWQIMWQPQTRVSQETMLFAHLIGPDGMRYAQADLVFPAPQTEPGRYSTLELPLTVPASAPAGSYKLVIGVYRANDGQRLPLTTPATTDPSLDGPNALVLDEIQLRKR